MKAALRLLLLVVAWTMFLVGIGWTFVCGFFLLLSGLCVSTMVVSGEGWELALVVLIGPLVLTGVGALIGWLGWLLLKRLGKDYPT